MQHPPSPATGHSGLSRCAARTQLSDIGNRTAIVTKCPLRMVTLTIGVNVDADRPFAPQILPRSVTPRSLATQRGNSPATRDSWRQNSSKNVVARLYTGRWTRVQFHRRCLRGLVRTLGDVAPNGAHCQGQSPGRLSAGGLGTLPFSGSRQPANLQATMPDGRPERSRRTSR